jgi:hypothetical protein
VSANARSTKICQARCARGGQVYESIHKAAQYNSGATQITNNMNISDGITMDLNEGFQCSFNAEENEAAARKYCENFTALQDL